MTIKEAIEELIKTKDYPISEPASDEALDMAIQALKRKRGKWIQNGTGYNDEPIYKCSQCSKRVTFWEDGSFNGCPYCFAEMKGVDE